MAVRGTRYEGSLLRCLVMFCVVLHGEANHSLPLEKPHRIARKLRLIHTWG